ncbi:MAG: 16S rRNA (cytosine(1402)-N(4))-methyltransferase RsmH [Deltaproteobacteria bacterium]|nr:16S rRNA (cytosine(1402)-N(4))-methyltransferase RsmH [Deltaproteobacteria bacterium]
METGFAHRSVLTSEVIGLLNCKPAGVYVDATIGGGGHAEAILQASAPGGVLIGLDRDAEALTAAATLLKAYGGRVRLVHENFRNIKKALAGVGVHEIAGAVFDLGVSSHQMDSRKRGFSFRFDSRLDMRMDAGEKPSAYELIAELSEEELERIFSDYGEERFARRIAMAIARVRVNKPIETTGELARLVLDAVPKKFHGTHIHPATRVFQALRIAVNDELESLKEGLDGAIDVLTPRGRVAVISFHSLEDRIVKTRFKELSAGCVCPPRIPRCVCGVKPSVKIITKKAVTPSEEEERRNPRARSAKLRAAEKL